MHTTSISPSDGGEKKNDDHLLSDTQIKWNEA